MELRPYQQRSIDQLYKWFNDGNKGHPCLVMPTGSGKSHIVAALCRDALQNWPETRILMLTHVKELIEQNAEKMEQHWPGSPMGIYSAGLRRKVIDQPITFAGIQSIRNKADEVGHVDLVIVDECHLISHKNEGSYRSFIDELLAFNPKLRVVGLTATPFRLGHGYIHEGEGLFSGLVEPVYIEELIGDGYLSMLRSKATQTKLSTDGVHKRGGEFIESELQAAVNKPKTNVEVVEEIIETADERKSWLFFCTGVAHAEAIKDCLIDEGISADCVTGKTPKAEREEMLDAFRAGEIQAITNANVLTTGFDHPGIDLIAMLRPTMSPGLYAQMAGRGMRIADGKDDCLVLDFAGNVMTHGPITNIQPPRKKGSGEAPCKLCPECDEVVHLSVMTCPCCGYEFPPPPPKKMSRHYDDIMGMDNNEIEVTKWSWRTHISRTSGKEMLLATYYGAMTDKPVREYLAVTHEGYAGSKALETLGSIAQNCGVDLQEAANLDDACWLLNAAPYPAIVKYRKDGNFFKIQRRIWDV